MRGAQAKLEGLFSKSSAAAQTREFKLCGCSLEWSSKGCKVSIQPCRFNKKKPYQQAAHFLPKLSFFVYHNKVLLKKKESVFILVQ